MKKHLKQYGVYKKIAKKKIFMFYLYLLCSHKMDTKKSTPPSTPPRTSDNSTSCTYLSQRIQHAMAKEPVSRVVTKKSQK
jgi:hypothetical protein